VGGNSCEDPEREEIIDTEGPKSSKGSENVLGLRIHLSDRQ